MHENPPFQKWGTKRKHWRITEIPYLSDSLVVLYEGFLAGFLITGRGLSLSGFLRFGLGLGLDGLVGGRTVGLELINVDLILFFSWFFVEKRD